MEKIYIAITESHEVLVGNSVDIFKNTPSEEVVIFEDSINRILENTLCNSIDYKFKVNGGDFMRSNLIENDSYFSFIYDILEDMKLPIEIIENAILKIKNVQNQFVFEGVM